MFILYSNIVKDQQDSEHNVKGFHMTISPDHSPDLSPDLSPDHSPDHYKYFSPDLSRDYFKYFWQDHSRDHFKYFWRDHSHDHSRSFIVIPPISGYPTHFPISIIGAISQNIAQRGIWRVQGGLQGLRTAVDRGLINGGQKNSLPK